MTRASAVVIGTAVFALVAVLGAWLYSLGLDDGRSDGAELCQERIAIKVPPPGRRLP